MKIQINLATRPFVELRPLFARLRIAMAVLGVLALGLGFGLHTYNAKAREGAEKMSALENRTEQLQREKMTAESRMRQPQNAAVLDRSHFLNDLFARKSFSWTAVMMDLEGVLPGGVQVTSIEPTITTSGDVNIRLKVAGDRDRAVELVRNLETSKRFLAPRLSDESTQAKENSNNNGRGPAMMNGPGGVEFDIFAGYNPLPAKGEKKSDEAKKTDEAKKPADTKVKAPAATGAMKAAKPAAGKPVVPKPGIADTAAAKTTPAKAAAPVNHAPAKTTPAAPKAAGGKQ